MVHKGVIKIVEAKKSIKLKEQGLLPNFYHCAKWLLVFLT